jgi:hypothetical protein
MEKECTCGRIMAVNMRTVVYQSHIYIENVPVFLCESCGNSEVYSPVRPELKHVLQDLKESSEKKRICFEDVSEIAHVILKLHKTRRDLDSSLEIMEERVNELLDIYLLARSLNDVNWVNEIRGKLLQISRQMMTAS